MISPSLDDRDQVFDHPDDIYRILKQLQKQRCILRVRFSNSDDTFNSCLLDLNPQAQTLTFDTLVPELGNNRLISQQPCVVNAYMDGVRINWQQPPLLQTESDEEGLRFILPYPSDIFYQQRRDHVRINIPGNLFMSTAIRFSNDLSQRAITGQITDLSISGFAARFPADNLKHLTANQRADHCTLIQDNAEIFHGPVVIHTPVATDNGDEARCGFEFMNLNQQAERRLSRFIVDLQRQLLRTSKGVGFTPPR